MKPVLKANFTSQISAPVTQLVSMATPFFVVQEDVTDKTTDDGDPGYVYRNDHASDHDNNKVVPIISVGLPFLHVMALVSGSGQASGSIKFKAYGLFPCERAPDYSQSQPGNNMHTGYGPHVVDPELFPDPRVSIMLGAKREGGPKFSGYFRPLVNPLDGTFEQTIALTTPKIAATKYPSDIGGGGGGTGAGSGTGEQLTAPYEVFDDNKMISVDGASVVLVCLSQAGTVGGSDKGVLLGQFKG